VKSLTALQRRTTLGAAGALTLGATFLLGLWPYQPLSQDGIRTIPQILHGTRSFLPTNDVSWLGTEPGLRFGDHGSAFSKSEFHSAAGASGCAIEIWLEPVSQKGQATILAFSTEETPVEFQVRQVGDQLVLWHPTRLPQKGEGQWLSVEHAVHIGKKLLITISSDGHETNLYLNGKLARRTPSFSIEPTDFRGTLVIGVSPEGHDPWKGILRGLAIYEGPVSSAQVQDDLQAWQFDTSRFYKAEIFPAAIYLFQEGQGEVAKSAVDGAPELVIPKTFSNLRPVLLRPFWKEFAAWDNFGDVAANIVGFVPLGFVVCLLLLEWGAGHPMKTAALLCFLVSLIIEIGQYLLPFRMSGTTDLLTNTVGSALGAWLGTRLGRKATQGARSNSEGKELPLGGKSAGYGESSGFPQG
jgi:hypothetical protein